VTPYHLGALAIAAAMVLICGTHPTNCTADTMREIVELAKMIAVGVLGNAGIAIHAARKAKKKDPPP
jgi:hypothetical protein